MELIKNIFAGLTNLGFKVGFMRIRILDVLDVSIVAFVLYKLYNTFRRTLIVQVGIAMIVFFLAWRVVVFLDMVLLKSILGQIVDIGSLALVVLFAPEIRRFFLSIRNHNFFFQLRERIAGGFSADLEYKEIIEACEALAAAHTGAIILLEGSTDLGHIEQTGDTINGAVSKRLLESIFNENSPLHDGAVLIRGNQIVAARCVLPISDDPDIPAELGMRHRAALGITEVSDSAAIVVSEETGKVSVTLAGRIKRNLSGEELLNFLVNYFDKGVKMT